jgi:hypothetical protein
VGGIHNHGVRGGNNFGSIPCLRQNIAVRHLILNDALYWQPRWVGWRESYRLSCFGDVAQSDEGPRQHGRSLEALACAPSCLKSLQRQVRVGGGVRVMTFGKTETRLR